MPGVLATAVALQSEYLGGARRNGHRTTLLLHLGAAHTTGMEGSAGGVLPGPALGQEARWRSCGTGCMYMSVAWSAYLS